MNLLEEIARTWCAAVDVDPDEPFDGKPCWTYYTDRAQALLPIIEKAVQAGLDAAAIRTTKAIFQFTAGIAEPIKPPLSASEIVKEMCGE